MIPKGVRFGPSMVKYVYKKLKSSDPERSKYGLIPRMASGSKGCISFRSAVSFCERVNSVGKDVTTDAHLLMNGDALEMIVVLRMNHEFMEFMRENTIVYLCNSLGRKWLI